MTWEKSGGYPAPGADRATSIAWSVLDEMASQSMMHGAIREALYVRLGTLVEQGEQEAANVVLHAFLDCWALGAVVDDARERWWHEADPAALAILVRAAQILGLAIGWSAGPAGPWPVPDSTWFDAHQRTWQTPPRHSDEAIITVSAEQLLTRNAELMQTIKEREIMALRLSGDPTERASHGSALHEMRKVLPRQHCFERAGHAAFHVELVPDHGDGWKDPLPGSPGTVLRPIADGVVVPALDTGAPMAMMGWLVWSGPHLPIRVHPIMVAILKEMNGRTESAQVASKLDIPPERYNEFLDSLLGLGAVTCV